MAGTRIFWRLLNGYVVLIILIALVLFFLVSRRTDVLVGDRTALVGDVVLSVSIAAFAAVVLSIVIARTLTKSLKRVARTADAIAKEQHASLLADESDDEIGELSRSFDRMAQEVSKRVSTRVRDRNELAAILGGMVEGIVAVNKEERIIHVNAVAGRFLGVRPAEVIDQRLEDVVRVREVAEVLHGAIRGGQPITGEVTLFPRPRRSLILEMYASPLLDGTNTLIGAVVVLHDVTELRHLEEVRRVFVANVSHELKTPITAIRGFSETMLDDSEMSPETLSPASLRSFSVKRSASRTWSLTF